MTTHESDIDEAERVDEQSDPLEFLPHLDDEHVAVVTIDDAEIVDDDHPTIVGRKPAPAVREDSTAAASTADRKTYIFLPFVFITVALLGGLRISSAEGGGFVFLAPARFCLIAASFLLVLFFRARLLTLDGWFSDAKTSLENVANAAVVGSLFAASTQVFNSLLPEGGLPFWVFAFCFFWTLWTNLFADFDVRRLLRSLAAMFALAFVVKYLVLASFAAPATDQGWLQSLLQNPTKEAITWLLDIPRYSAATGYIQFFTIVFYLLGLYLLPRRAS